MPSTTSRTGAGEGVAQDDNEAVKWYRKAAEQGDATAQAKGVKAKVWIPYDLHLGIFLNQL
jgi:TPR repeat protein